MADSDTGGKADDPKALPIPPHALAAIARGVLQREGSVVIHQHCARRMREPDRDFSTADVMWIIESGDYAKYAPEWRTDHQNWLYSVAGRDLDGRRLKLVFTVEREGSLIQVISGQRFSKGKRV